MPYTIPFCDNFPCENKLPEKYYRVIRVIKTGNRRRSFCFCSLKCMQTYFVKMTENSE